MLLIELHQYVFYQDTLMRLISQGVNVKHVGDINILPTLPVITVDGAPLVIRWWHPKLSGHLGSTAGNIQSFV